MTREGRACTGRTPGKLARPLHFLDSAAVYPIVIHMANVPSATSVLSVRVNPDERALLEAVAEQARTSLSDYLRRKAVEVAETDVLNRSIITIPAKDWEAFEAWLKRPAKAIPALQKLARSTPSWDR